MSILGQILAFLSVLEPTSPRMFFPCGADGQSINILGPEDEGHVSHPSNGQSVSPTGRFRCVLPNGSRRGIAMTFSGYLV